MYVKGFSQSHLVESHVQSGQDDVFLLGQRRRHQEDRQLDQNAGMIVMTSAHIIAALGLPSSDKQGQDHCHQGYDAAPNPHRRGINVGTLKRFLCSQSANRRVVNIK